MKECKITELYNLEKSIVKANLEEHNYPWEILPLVGKMIEEINKELPKEYKNVNKNIWIHESAKISETAKIEGPCIIGKNTTIRHGAYIRENVIIGDNCVIGNSTEIKNSILFDEVKAPHFNYIGDSVLGYKAHLGAGVILSNLKSDEKEIKIRGDKTIDTKLKKVGAFIGDYVEIGCNSVLNPGTIIGKNTTIYPLSNVRGLVDSNKIYKDKNTIVQKK